jgi:CBS domain-containing protein
MAIGEICNRDVVVVEKDDTVQEAARLMRQYHVGDLVVTRVQDGVRVPVGLITDRDIVLEVLGEGLDIDAVTVGDIMSDRLIIAREEDELWDSLQRMRIAGVRRLPVVDGRGGLQGIVTPDDVIELLSEELAQVAKLLSREQAQEQATRPRR